MPSRLCRNNRVTIAFHSFYLPQLGGWGAFNASRQRPLTVLVVEDDGLIREDMVLGLQQEGWIVLEAPTGAAALKALDETAEAFRTSSPIGAVIYASGAPSDDGRRVPESIFLSKPVAPRELLAACHALLPSGR